MKKVFLLVCAMFFSSANASVISIGLDGANPAVGVGETVSVNINLTDVVDDFSGFFVGFEFDTSIFKFVEGSVSSGFPPLDFSTFSGFAADTFLAADGNIFLNLFEDFLSPVVYGAGDYLVASFDLLIISAGETSLSFLDTELSAPSDLLGSFPDPIALDAVNSSVSVSAPGSLALMGFAALALLGLRRKA